VVNKYKEVFIKDKYMNLIKRLIINVIKLGFRKINLSYSKISFRDISEKLGLKESDDIEFIIAKQIRDGVIQAEIDHEN
jgi:26S proteasome regulatory subunit N3